MWNKSLAMSFKWLAVVAALMAHINTVSAQPAGKAVTYQSGGMDYEGYYVSVEQGAPLLLLLHDWDGLTSYERDRAEMLAEMGFAVFAADLFGKGVRPTEVADKRQHTGELYKDREKMRRLMQAAMTKGAELNGSDVTVAFGYCFGGAAVLELARSGVELAGFASFHGGLSTPEGQDYKATQGKVLVFHGTADSMISMNDFASLADELEAAAVDHEMIAYGGAPHAFTVFGSDRYRQEADTQSWVRFTRFLKSVSE
ncbi:MAG: dienelactone hydrolase family protein [Oleiphilaceae bacterium]|nr:dienelactone hydrolase family protein [Oleiphilaceae bacterium]